MPEQNDQAVGIRIRALELALTVTGLNDEGRTVHLDPDEIIPTAAEFEKFIAGIAQ